MPHLPSVETLPDPLPVHVPNAAWQPVPQKSVLAPHHPPEEQQSPYARPLARLAVGAAVAVAGHVARRSTVSEESLAAGAAVSGRVAAESAGRAAVSEGAAGAVAAVTAATGGVRGGRTGTRRLGRQFVAVSIAWLTRGDWGQHLRAPPGKQSVMGPRQEASC